MGCMVNGCQEAMLAFSSDITIQFINCSSSDVGIQYLVLNRGELPCHHFYDNFVLQFWSSKDSAHLTV